MINQGLLNQLPDRISRPPKPVDSKEYVLQGEMAEVLKAIHRELAKLHASVRDHSATNALGSSLADIELAISSMSNEDIVEKLDEVIRAFPTEAPQITVEAPVVNLPTDDFKAILEAIRGLKFEASDKVSVTNLSEVTKLLADMKPLLTKIESAVQASKSEPQESVVVSNLTDLKLPEFPKEALELLENLDTDAKNPIAVRLSDGNKFYNLMEKVADTGTRAVAMGTTPSFKDSTGTPQRALVDSNGSVKTTTDVYTVKLEYVGNNPVYVGKALPGSSVSSAAWQIQKLTYSGNNVTDVQWAGGSSGFAAIWNDRATYSYS